MPAFQAGDPGSNPGRGIKLEVQSLFYKDYCNQQRSIFYVSNTFQITLYQSRSYFGTEFYVSNSLLLLTRFSLLLYRKNLFETCFLPENCCNAFTFHIAGVSCSKLKVSGLRKCHLKHKNENNPDCRRFIAVISCLLYTSPSPRD